MVQMALSEITLNGVSKNMEVEVNGISIDQLSLRESDPGDEESITENVEQLKKCSNQSIADSPVVTVMEDSGSNDTETNSPEASLLPDLSEPFTREGGASSSSEGPSSSENDNVKMEAKDLSEPSYYELVLNESKFFEDAVNMDILPQDMHTLSRGSPSGKVSVESLPSIVDLCQNTDDSEPSDDSSLDYSPRGKRIVSPEGTPEGKALDPSVESHNCLHHPGFLSLTKDLEERLIQISALRSSNKELEMQVLENRVSSERLHLLEAKLNQQEKELSLSKQEHDLDVRTIVALKKDMESKLDALKKQYEQANKDKEAMVMRYAVSEKDLIAQKKENEAMDKKLKDMAKENENLIGKIKVVSGEKARLGQLLDNKCTELSLISKEVDRLKEEINARDIKIKWIQNKVKTEMDLHKDCPIRMDKFNQRVQQLEEELESAKRELQNKTKELQDSQLNRATEEQLKEEQAKLILERHEHSERETQLRNIQARNAALVDLNTGLLHKVDRLEEGKAELEQKLAKTREEVTLYINRIGYLEAKIREVEERAAHLQQKRDELLRNGEEVEKLRKSNEELVGDMASCKEREAEMLSFTQKLTSKNVQLQSDFTAVEARVEQLEKEHSGCENTLDELRREVKRLEQELRGEKERRNEERGLLVRQVAEKTTHLQEAERALQEARADINLLKNKQSTFIKELQRELQHYRKNKEPNDSGECGGSDSLNQRASSLSSLNESRNPPSLQIDVAQKALVDRIVKLQHEIARQKERIEFLEDHTEQLVRELQKKTRLLQSYILKQETGALTSRSMDNNKAEVARHGGIMASLFGSRPMDDTMTLELSLEINHKLQAILEDTLLKNITLKENLDTLGDEVARLSQQKVP